LMTLSLTPDAALAFLLVLCRTATLVALAPGIGARYVPPMAKLGVAVVVSVALMPMAAARGEVPVELLPFALAIAREFLVGAGLAFVINVLFWGAEFGGHAAGLQMGFALSEIFDPETGEEQSVSGAFYYVFALALFFALDGHAHLLAGLARSFELAPLGLGAPRPEAVRTLIGASAEVFELGLRLGAPAMLALLIASAALGFVARAVPQMNVFFVGYPAKVAVGILVMALACPLTAAAFAGALPRLERMALQFAMGMG